MRHAAANWSMVRRRTGLATAFAFLLMAVSGLSLTPGDAHACGGLFCNARPPDPFAPLPIAQNGENVVFSITPDPAGGAPTLVAHIQILYTGEAAKFSWVVPVDSAPVLSPGTDRLFTALASVTQPRFETTSETEGTCLPNSIGAGGSSGSGGASATSSGGASGSGGTSGGGVTVTFQGAVGPFDAAVIQSDDAMILKLWLTENGYIISDAAAGLIDVYVREHKYFVALKLLNGVGVRQIQPIVLTFRGTEPCVPLRLTAIAANPDMPVLLWVLADKRTVPKGFFEIKVDEARIDWLAGGQNYFGPRGLVSLAADEAGGNAFVTEYAGPATIAADQVYLEGQFDLGRLETAMTPPVYVQALLGMGLGNDPQTLPLLSTYIPMPMAVKDMNVTESQFYGNLSFYWGLYAISADLPGLTQAIRTTIIKPRQDAQKMIDARPYLTRLNTYLSPDEMNKDPLFFINRDLPDVANVHTATFRAMCGNREFMLCNAPIRMELQDGRKAWVRPGSKIATCQSPPYDFSHLDKLPATDIAWEREVTGEGRRILDNATTIAAGIAANNNAFPAEQARFPIGAGQTGGAPGGGGSGGGAGPGGQSGGNAGGNAGGLLGTGGRRVSAGTRSGDGCACAAVGGDTSGGCAGAGLLVALVVLRRRRDNRNR